MSQTKTGVAKSSSFEKNSLIRLVDDDFSDYLGSLEIERIYSSVSSATVDTLPRIRLRSNG
jgi:hypothetical protein